MALRDTKTGGKIQKAASNMGMKPSKLYSILSRLRRERAVWRYKENRLLTLCKDPILRRILEPTAEDHIYAQKLVAIEKEEF